MLTAAVLLAALHAASPAARARALSPLYERAALAHGISPKMLARVCGHESGHRVWAVGDHGRAFGACQVHRDGIPGRLFTRAELMRPDVNVDAAAEHLARDLERCHGRIAAAVQRYNVGHGCAPGSYARRVLLTEAW